MKKKGLNELENIKMTRKNPQEYTQMQIKRTVLEKLKKLKIHPNQSYSEVIEKTIINKKNE